MSLPSPLRGVSQARFCRVRRGAPWRNVETLHYVELSHVLRVLYLQLVQNFQDLLPAWRECRDSSRRVCTTRLAMVVRNANEFTDNFNQPERQWDILATPERTSAFLARHGMQREAG
jgi:hypothetical protein